MNSLVFLISTLLLISCGYEGKTSLSHSKDAGASTERSGKRDDNFGVQSSKLSAEDCIDPDLSKLQKGERLMLCDGSFGVGTLDISSGMGKAKQCRNVASSSIRASANANFESFAFSGASMYQITVPNGDKTKLYAGLPVMLSPAGGSLPTGLNTGSIYYLIPTNSYGTAFQLGASLGAALSISNYHTDHTRMTSYAPVSFALSGSGTLKSIIADNVWDTIDDLYEISVITPELPWGDNTVCDDSIVPVPNRTSNLTPQIATVDFVGFDSLRYWSEIWRDKNSGLYFTNVLQGTSSYPWDWATSLSMCQNLLNSGDGLGKWRLPTQKELMQLYINGLGRKTISAESSLPASWSDDGTTNLWSSTVKSNDPKKVWTMNPANGEVKYQDRTITTLRALCVRDEPTAP